MVVDVGIQKSYAEMDSRVGQSLIEIHAICIRMIRTWFIACALRRVQVNSGYPARLSIPEHGEFGIRADLVISLERRNRGSNRVQVGR